MTWIKFTSCETGDSIYRYFAEEPSTEEIKRIFFKSLKNYTYEEVENPPVEWIRNEAEWTRFILAKRVKYLATLKKLLR